MALSICRLATPVSFVLGSLLLLTLVAKAGAVDSRLLPDPYPDIYPGGESPKRYVTSAVYTGNPAKVLTTCAYLFDLS